jgi:hypothetical protein
MGDVAGAVQSGLLYVHLGCWGDLTLDLVANVDYLL